MNLADEPQAEVARRPRLVGWGKGCLAVLGVFLLVYLAVLLLFGSLVPIDTVELRISNRDDEYLCSVWPVYEVLAPEKLPPLAALTF